MIASVVKSLHKAGKSLNKINNLIVQSDNKIHTDCDISQITHSPGQNIFVSDLFECSHEEDINTINSYLKDVLVATKLGLSVEFVEITRHLYILAQKPHRLDYVTHKRVMKCFIQKIALVKMASLVLGTRKSCKNLNEKESCYVT